MSYLYVNDDGVVISIEGNRCVAKYKDGMKQYLPIESLEGIVIMGHSQLTTNCMEQCLLQGINVSFFSKVVSILEDYIPQDMLRRKDRDNNVFYMIQILRCNYLKELYQPRLRIRKLY